jgi:hypothetical protein
VEDLTAYFTALGLATAAGLNAWLPLLATGLLARYTDLLDLEGTWASLEDTGVLVALAGVTVADFVGDKIPAVDHALHAAGTVIAPATGAVAALSSSSALDVSPALMTIIGLVAAETSHGTRMAIRPFSTATTGGLGNPVLSLVEDVLSLGLSVVAIVLPVLALLLVVALLVAAWRAIRRLRLSRARRAAAAAAPPG